MKFSLNQQNDNKVEPKGLLSLRKTFIVALAASTFLPVMPSMAANTLMELFQQKRQQQAAPAAPAAKAAPARDNTKRVSAPQNSAITAAPVKRVTVKGPQLYNYKPDALVKVDFSALDMQVTGAIEVQADATNIALAPALKAESAGHKQYATSINQLKNIDVQAEKKIAQAIIDYYSDNRAFLWSADNQVAKKAKKMAALFAAADEEGLNAEEYAVRIPSDHFDPTLQDARLQELADFEILMTARALRYAMDAGEGRIIADRLSGFHDLPRGRVNPKDVLEQLSQQSDPAAFLSGFNPSSPAYIALKHQLAEMGPTTSKTIRITLDKAIRPGDKTDQMSQIVALISRHAPKDYLATHADVLNSHANADVYDAELVSAIKDYQTYTGSTPDGIIGKNTIAALQGEQDAIKRDRILYSMERLRWLPHDFGSRYVMINQPSYRAEYFEDGKEKLAMNTVIGSPRHQTNFFYDKVQTVVFNPSWGVPRSIIMNEMLPKIMRDRSYLERNGYEVYVGGKKVSASSVNWNAVASGKAHVGIRQKPSASNSLGELKILFPNAHDIYMHDTPAKSYFQRDMRALSHGCVRLERPRDMAAAVLGRPVEDLGKYFGKNERGLKVAEPVPVYLTYFTAWPDANGNIQYYNDVYERDTALQKAFQKTEEARLAAL